MFVRKCNTAARVAHGTTVPLLHTALSSYIRLLTEATDSTHLANITATVVLYIYVSKFDRKSSLVEAAAVRMAGEQRDLACISVLSAWIVLSVSSNVLVLLVVLSNKRMHSVTNFLMCNLAASDIFLAAFVLPQNVHDLSHTQEFHEGQSVTSRCSYILWSMWTLLYTLLLPDVVHQAAVTVVSCHTCWALH